MNKLLLIFLVLLTIFLRFYELGLSPYGLNDDEVSFGYNAYSILQSGADEHGKKLPLAFEAFGDYKMPLQVYILVPVIKIFGLNAYAIRMPSAVAGCVFVLAIYFLLRNLKLSFKSAYFGALVAAVSPWSIILSRFAYESNIALALFTISLAIFAKIYFSAPTADSKHKIMAIFAIMLLAATWYAYVPYRVVSTLSVGTIMLIFLYSRKVNIKTAFVLLALFGLLVSPLLPQTLSGAAAARLRQVTHYSRQSQLGIVNANRGFCKVQMPEAICKLLANSTTQSAFVPLTNIVEAISPQFLFLHAEGDLLSLSVRGYGVMPAYSMVFAFIGVLGYCALFARGARSDKFVLLLIATLFVFSILPPALTSGPQRVRYSSMLPFIGALVAMGFEQTFNGLKKHVNHLFLFAVVTVAFLGIVYFFTLTKIHIPQYENQYKNNIARIMAYLSPKDKVLFEAGMENVFINYAYYKQIDPAIYQTQKKLSLVDELGFAHYSSFLNLGYASEDIKASVCREVANGNDVILVTSKQDKTGFIYDSPIKIIKDTLGHSTWNYIYKIEAKKYISTCLSST